MKKMKRFLSILLIVAIGSSLIFQHNVYAGITEGDISDHDQVIISAKKYAKKAYKEFAQESRVNANKVIDALRLACNVFDATGSVDLTREAFADYLGGEKGFIWVNDDGSYALTKELIEEFKAFLKKQGTGTSHGSITQPITLKSQTFENYFEKHFEIWGFQPIHKFCHTLNLYDMFGSKLDSNDFVYASHRSADEECIHLIDNGYSSEKYEYHFFYGGFASDVEIGKAVATYGLGGALYNARIGATVEHSDGRYSYCLTGSGTVTEGDYDGYSYSCVRLSETVYDCLTIATSDGRPFFYFSSYADGVQYYDSLYSSLNKAGITINNYNQVVKYVNNDNPSGFIVVSPDDDMTVEPSDYTFDTPTAPGDSSGGSDSGGCSSSADSSGIIKAINKLYDLLEQKLDKIISQLRYNNFISTVDLIEDIAADILTGIEKTINNFSLTFRNNVKEIGGMCQKKFPLSIPFDVLIIMKLLKAEPVTPVFKIPFQNKSKLFPINETITIDFSVFDDSIVYMRIFILLVYCYGLLMLTLRVVRSNTYIDAN